MKYRITSTEPDLIERKLIVKAVQNSSTENKEEEATVDDGDDLIRFIAIFEVPHYDHLVGREIGEEKDATLQDSINNLLIID